MKATCLNRSGEFDSITRSGPAPSFVLIARCRPRIVRPMRHLPEEQRGSALRTRVERFHPVEHDVQELPLLLVIRSAIPFQMMFLA